MGASSPDVWHGTTILTVRKGGKVVIAGDGQVTLGQTIIKGNAKKVRRVGTRPISSPASPGRPPTPSPLFERLETKLERFPGSAEARLRRARQGLAHRPLSSPPRGHDDRGRRRREPGLDRHRRRARARRRGHGHRLRRRLTRSPPPARCSNSDLDAEAIARKAMAIAADICVYTNKEVVLETLDSKK